MCSESEGIRLEVERSEVRARQSTYDSGPEEGPAMVTPAERQEQALSDFTQMNSAERVTTGCERGSEKEPGVIL